MFLNRSLLITLAGLYLGGPAVFASTSRCGGDGPNPLSDITGEFTPQIEPLHTNGAPQEFVVWESKKSLIYRNQDGEVWSHPMGGTAAPVQLTQAPAPLLRFYDPSERFLATDQGNWLFDASGLGRWFQLGVSAEMRPVFSNQNSVYGVEVPSTAQSSWGLYRYQSGVGLTATCSYLSLDGSYLLASGHRYPYIYFYESLPDAYGNNLIVHRVDVSDCSVRDSQFRYSIKGNIQEVFFFNTPGAVAVKIDNPTENLLWNTDQGGCRYYNIDNLFPLQLNPDQPFLATESSDVGLTLIDLENARKARVMKRNRQLGQLRDSDLYLTGDGNDLFVRATGSQRLLRMKIDQRIWTQD